MWNYGADFCCTDLLLRIITVNRQMDVLIPAIQSGFPVATRGSNCFSIVHVDVTLQAMPGERAVHGARIDVSVVERLRHQLGIGAFTTGARAIYGDDDWLFLLHDSQSANN